jgi:hypothetical protein
MIEILNKIFTDDLFLIKDIDNISGIILDGFLAVPSNKTRKEYFIVIEVSDLVPLITHEEDNVVFKLNSWLKSSDYYNSAFNKNTTLIILQKASIIIEEKTKRQIFEIEENPYIFKKYVIRYTIDQFKSLFKILPDVSINSMNQLINQLDFEVFKENPTSEDYIPLLINLFIKIPFLKVPFQEKELDNLTDVINQKINRSTTYQNIEEIHQLCLKSTITDVFELFNIPKKQHSDEI